MVPAWVAVGPQNIGPHSGGSTGSPGPSTSLISGAANFIAALLGTADRSTNIEVVTFVSSGLGGGPLLSGAADSVTADEHETVVASTTVAVATAIRLSCPARTPAMSSPGLRRPRLSRTLGGIVWIYLDQP